MSEKAYSVYFASPWFNPTQAEREERVKNKLRDLGFDVWSPKENNSLSPITDPIVRQKIFAANIDGIENCEIIFAITDEKDMGTIWEAGFACGMRHALNEVSVGIDIDSEVVQIIVYYCETLGDGAFNLMLAQSGDIVITSFEELDDFRIIVEQFIREGEGKRYVGNAE